ncbi:hypothetical protein ACFL0T_06810 [Candidatus Omnitrophota bacterium]
MQTEVLISHKEHIRKILSRQHVKRPATLERDIDFSSRSKELKSDKFFLFDFNGPFQTMSSKLGLEKALIQFAQEPRHVLSYFKDILESIFKQYNRCKDEGYQFDGVWIWEDIAYDKGLLFSVARYRSQLIALHRELCDFFNSEGLLPFMHCDGNVESLIPLWVSIGVKGIHPIQEQCNPNILQIKDIFKQAMTFVGGVGVDRVNKGRKELLDRLRELNAGGSYIFSLDGPLIDEANKREYNIFCRDLEIQGV